MNMRGYAYCTHARLIPSLHVSQHPGACVHVMGVCCYAEGVSACLVVCVHACVYAWACVAALCVGSRDRAWDWSCVCDQPCVWACVCVRWCVACNMAGACNVVVSDCYVAAVCLQPTLPINVWCNLCDYQYVFMRGLLLCVCFVELHGYLVVHVMCAWCMGARANAWDISLYNRCVWL